jgi:hypothetical protein
VVIVIYILPLLGKLIRPGLVNYILNMEQLLKDFCYFPIQSSNKSIYSTSSYSSSGKVSPCFQARGPDLFGPYSPHKKKVGLLIAYQKIGIQILIIKYMQSTLHLGGKAEGQGALIQSLPSRGKERGFNFI